MNDFLNAEQRVRLACVLKHKKEFGSYSNSEAYFLTAPEICFILDDGTTTATLGRMMAYIMDKKIRPRLRLRGIDGSEFSQEVLQ